MPIFSSLFMMDGSTASDDAVPSTTSSSARRNRISLKMLKPATRRIVPSTTTTKVLGRTIEVEGTRNTKLQLVSTRIGFVDDSDPFTTNDTVGAIFDLKNDVVYLDNQSANPNDLSVTQALNLVSTTELRFPGNGGLGGIIDITPAGTTGGFDSLASMADSLGAQPVVSDPGFPGGPTVSSVALTGESASRSSGVLNAGDVVTATVAMSAAVTVTGAPQLRAFASEVPVSSPKSGPDFGARNDWNGGDIKQWHERERKTLLPLTVDFALGVIAIVPWKTKSSRLPNFEPKTLLRNSSLLEAGAQGYWRQHSLCL